MYWLMLMIKSLNLSLLMRNKVALVYLLQSKQGQKE